ncbi:MAG TPA: GldG family protein [Verrucomicrobiae bacterium]|nr:GldG family protein [Verrucomicrobiae bacterium]
MAPDPDIGPSFSPTRKWVIALNVAFIITVVFGIVLMVNYLSRRHFVRLHVSTQSKVKLFPRTRNLLRSLTNSVQVTLYYDREDPFYATIAELLGEYQNANPRISLRVVDYRRDPGAAQLLRTNYTFLALRSAKNLIIFDGGEKRRKVIDGDELVKYATKQALVENRVEFTRKPTLFEGERAFTAALVAVTTPKPLRAFVLAGHGEHRIDSEDESMGYKKFADVLQTENYIQLETVSLMDTNHPPLADCNLLIIPGPLTRFEDAELEMIDQYLAQGGHLLALFNVLSIERGDTGLERVLTKWGVNVTPNIITDPENHAGEQDVIVATFSNHPLVSALAGNELRLHMILPRSIAKVRSRPSGADAASVEEVAFTGPRSYVRGDEHSGRHAYPLMVAVEKGGVKGVVTERGSMRMVVAGDSIFLANHQIESAANREFANMAANWLLDRPTLVEGIGPQNVTEYRLVMTNSQLQGAEWVLLAGMPGAVLLLGGIVWLRRRS